MYSIDYNVNLLDNVLENKINSYKLGFIYISPKKYLPKIGFQIKEIYELKNDYIGDPNGICAVWCVWWADIRINNPDIPRKKLADLLNKEIINNDYSFKKIIRDYSNYITAVRDKMFNKSNININDWINDNISSQNEKLLNETIKNEIVNIIK